MGTITSSEESNETATTIQNELAKVFEQPKIEEEAPKREEEVLPKKKVILPKPILKEQVKPPPPLPKKIVRNLKESLLKEISEGIEALGNRDLAAWICRANNQLDADIVQRARRTFTQRLKDSKMPASMVPKLLPTVRCPTTISVDVFDNFLNSAEMRRPPRVNVEYWKSAPNAPWRDGLTKAPVTKQITIKKEIELKAKNEERDGLSAAAGQHAEKLHGFGVSATWLLAFTFALDLWEWCTWEVQLLIVKSATEFRGRCRFAELPEVKPHTGPASVYACHSWGNRWGDLVAAVSTTCGPERFIWIDIFAVRQWPGNTADLNFRDVVALCDSVIVVVPFQPLSMGATCHNYHSLVSKQEENKKGIRFTEDTKESPVNLADYSAISKKEKLNPNKKYSVLSKSSAAEDTTDNKTDNKTDNDQSGISFGGVSFASVGFGVTSLSVGEEKREEKRDSITSIASMNSITSSIQSGSLRPQEESVEEVCARCGSQEVTLVCRKCSYFMCDDCNQQVISESAQSWFLQDDRMIPSFMASEVWSTIVEKQPTLRLWCLVEIQAALALNKAVILKVGKHTLSEMPKEQPAPVPVAQKKKKKKLTKKASVLALEAMSEKKRLPLPFEGCVTFSECEDKEAMSIFLLNMSCLVDHTEAAFSLPDDLEREMLLLGKAANTIDIDISTVVSTAAFEARTPEVEGYLCGERDPLRNLPQSKVYAAFDAAASGGRIDVMCELLASRPEHVGDLGYHLSRSAMKGRLGSMLFLLNYGANVNSMSYGRTPLTNAVEHGQVDAVAMLLEKGAQVNIDAGGRGTALWWAASTDNEVLVKMLLEHGADPDMASVGQTPLMIAEASATNNQEIIHLLKKASE